MCIRDSAWIDSVLANAKEDWIIVAGHHPIYAETPKDDSERLDMQKVFQKAGQKSVAFTCSLYYQSAFSGCLLYTSI